MRILEFGEQCSAQVSQCLLTQMSCCRCVTHARSSQPSSIAHLLTRRHPLLLICQELDPLAEAAAASQRDASSENLTLADVMRNSVANHCQEELELVRQVRKRVAGGRARKGRRVHTKLCGLTRCCQINQPFYSRRSSPFSLGAAHEQVKVELAAGCT